MNRTTAGVLFALAAFGFWGVMPVFWKQLGALDAFELLGHRMMWGAATLGGVLIMRRGPRALLVGLRPANFRILVFSALCIGGNWLSFIWAVNAGHIVEVSLGYFINPLLSVLLGVLVLRERLRTGQWIAVAFAGVGIAFLAARGVGNPLISLSLAGSFGVYGLLRKYVSLESSEALFFEMFLVSCIYAPYMIYRAANAQLLSLNAPPQLWVLVVLTGAVTVLPLFCFGKAISYLPLSTVGITQYLAPTLQLLLGVFLYGEAFTSNHGWSFGLIWVGLLVFSAEAVFWTKQRGSTMRAVAKASAKPTRR